MQIVTYVMYCRAMSCNAMFSSCRFMPCHARMHVCKYAEMYVRGQAGWQAGEKGHSQSACGLRGPTGSRPHRPATARGHATGPRPHHRSFANSAISTNTAFKSPQPVQSRRKPCGARHGSEVNPAGVKLQSFRNGTRILECSRRGLKNACPVHGGFLTKQKWPTYKGAYAKTQCGATGQRSRRVACPGPYTAA